MFFNHKTNSGFFNYFISDILILQTNSANDLEAMTESKLFSSVFSLYFSSWS